MRSTRFLRNGATRARGGSGVLVLISDLHLTDGSAGETVHEGTLRVFRERLRALAYAASWRPDGKYRPVESISLVLLGDILDVLRSSQWLRDDRGKEETLRPWSDARDPLFANKIEAITTAILKRNAGFMAMMRGIAGECLSIPRAGRLGLPLLAEHADEGAARAPVRVRIHYMAGNHDWYFHLSGGHFNRIRRQVAEALELENDPSRPFPHDANEPDAGAVSDLFKRHRLIARHGDIYDPFNFDGDRNASSLGDAIVIDLLLTFISEIHRRFRHSLPPECLAGFSEIDNVRPVFLAPVWVGGIIRRACPEPRWRRQVQDVWNDVASRFLRIPFVRDHLKSRRRCLQAEKLRLILKLSQRSLHPGSRRLLSRLGASAFLRQPSYFRYALRERDAGKGGCRFVVYGHTHRYEMVPLDGAGGDPGRIYFNSGTWRPVHELARGGLFRESFAAYNSMTYLAFFEDDERGGRGFESWSGNLGRPAAFPTSGDAAN
ncbi:MAG: hypothetical protein KGM47_03975 [Acidobacteriota bacterium]|nr:hypothetical protein [Acidobacteriota bacterium]